MLALSNLLLMGAAYGLLFWAPALLRGWGAQNHMELGLLAAIPQLAGIAGMLLIARDSDRRRERRGHFVASTVIAAAGLGLVVAADGALAWSLAGLCVAMVGIAAATPLFAAILIDYLPRQRAAAGIALVNSIGLLGGAVTPALGGRLLAAEGTAALLLLMVGLYLLAGFVLLLALRLDAGVSEEDDEDDEDDNRAQN
jgi:MFS family permease